jgi:MFS family permease
LRDAIALYPVYPVLFADHGLSTTEISALFVLWSAATIVLQLPAGALADRVSRRQLLVLSALVRAAGFGLWVMVPSFGAFAAGFVLWGVSSSLRDGTFEAFVFDELVAVGAAPAYGRLTARSGTVALVASVGASALAIPLLHLGGFGLVGAASVVVAGVEAAVALSLPARPRVMVAGGGGWPEYVRTLRAGVVEAAAHPRVRGIVLIAAVLPGLSAIDEYVPLLGNDYHVAPAAVPVFLLTITATAAIGNWASGRWWSIRGAAMAVTLAVGAAALAASGLTHEPIGFTGVAVAFGIVQFGMTSSEVRLQHAISGSARATVTSVAGAGAELSAIAVFAASAGVGQVTSTIGLLASFAVPLALVAAVTPWWLRQPLRASESPAESAETRNAIESSTRPPMSA